MGTPVLGPAGMAVLLLLPLAVGGMVSVTDYWPEVAADLTLVSWSHATNSRDLLAQALADSTMMIEADVSLGPGGDPIMAHPPANTSDLSLQRFLTTVLDATENNAKKGIKLDFKFIEVVEPSLKIVKGLLDRITMPLWLNADIIPGPGGGAPVDGPRFLELCSSHLPEATLSLGLTTAAQGRYTREQLEQVLDLVLKHKVTAPVTLPIRASLATASLPTIKAFLNQEETSNMTLTIWSGSADQVDKEQLEQFILGVGKDRVYEDVPWSSGQVWARGSGLLLAAAVLCVILPSY